MAFTHGKDSKFFLTDTSSTEQDLSSYVNNVPAAIARAMAEVTAYGDQGQRFIPGLENASFEVSGHFDPAAHTTLSGLFKKTDAPTTWVYGPAGDTSGSPRLTADCWVQAYNVTAPVGDKVSFTATLQMDGAVTMDTFT